MKRLGKAGLATVLIALCLAAPAAFHPAVQQRGSIIAAKLRGRLPTVGWSRVVAAMAPAAWQSAVRSLVVPGPEPFVQSLDPPSRRDKRWAMRPLFYAPTSIFGRLDCHVSILEAGLQPHPPHTHVEEEVILLLSGEADIIRGDLGKQSTERIVPGQFVFHSPRSPHTIKSSDAGPASYLVLKWRGRHQVNRESPLPPSTFRFDHPFERHARSPRRFATTKIFESPTDWLAKLHGHVTTMKPGAGYEPHRDPYDIVMVLLEGVVETLGRRVEPNSLIFFPADKPHGMKNPGDEPAQYLVFEFHGPDLAELAAAGAD